MLYYFRYDKLEHPSSWRQGCYGAFFDDYERILIYTDVFIESINFNSGDYGIWSELDYIKIE